LIVSLSFPLPNCTKSPAPDALKIAVFVTVKSAAPNPVAVNVVSSGSTAEPVMFKFVASI
jgi:hypothetical protein